MSEYAEEFKKLYKEKYELFYNKMKSKESLEELQREFSILCACADPPNSTEEQTQTPIIVGNAINRISVTNIGSFPPFAHTKFIIYPINYTSKHKYKMHKNYKKSAKDKILYVCSIKKDGFCISADDGYKWDGENFWTDFVNDLNCTDFKSFEEFFGLTHPSITKLIESIGDISDLQGYIPYEKRDIVKFNYTDDSFNTTKNQNYE